MPPSVESELVRTTTDPAPAEALRAYPNSGYSAIAFRPDAIGPTVHFVIEPPADVDLSEIVVRATAPDHCAAPVHTQGGRRNDAQPNRETGV